MKIKERALAILLSMVMVLTFMPALAFAEGEKPAETDGTLKAEEPVSDVSEGDIEVKEDSARVESENTDSSLEEPEFEPITANRQNAVTDEPISVSYNGTPKKIYHIDFDSNSDEEYGWVGRYYDLEPSAGDTITVNYDENTSIVYTAVVDDEGFIYYFENDEENDSVRFDYSYGWDEDIDDYKESLKVVHGHIGDGGVWVEDWQYQLDVPEVPVVDEVSGIAFEPSSITLEASDIYCEYSEEDEAGNPVVWFKGYDLDRRFIDDDGTLSPFVPGDKFIVRLSDGSSKVFTYKLYTDSYIDEDGNQQESTGYGFVSDDKIAIPRYDIGYTINNGWELNLGTNAVGFTWNDGVDHSYSATLNVVVDSAEQRAARAAAVAEAARQGVYDPSLPKVKASKPKASKKAFTAKWKKLKKKQLKSGATNIEVWACADGAFAAGSTIERVVGKKKASTKIKGMAKGTYFVKVRAIKYVGGVKYVGPWSAVKKVKVKK